VKSRFSTLAVLAAVSLGGFVSACGGGSSGDSPTPSATPMPTPSSAAAITSDTANAKVHITIGSKNFTEQEVLGEIYAQGLRAAGYTVKTRLDVGDQDATHRALLAGRIDAYPEYTGTALLSFFGMRPGELPKDPKAAYEAAKQGFAGEDPPLVAFPPTPFSNSNEVAVTRATAQKYRLRRISDLRRAARQLRLYGSPECRRRLDCLRGLEKIYGLRFASFTPVRLGRRHEVLASGRADVSIVFTTDPQIKRRGEVLLVDDKGMFPPYNTTLVARKELTDAAGPDLAKTVKLLQEQLTDENMQELNARVSLDGKPPSEVAREYLQETGLIGA
jgi:osmoprotectant transport system substrate-binding protein